MTKEQEKAIKECETLKKCLMQYSDEPENIKTGKAIETVLSMLKENSAEIEQKNTELAEKTAEIEKKDRQINFMANFINDNIPYTKDTKELENEEGIRTADFTVKYFERKVKE